jgi:hypothetical protein
LRRVAPWLAVLFAMVVAAPLVAVPRAAAEDAPAPAEPATAGPRWPYALPFMAEAAVERGYELPLPRGISGIFYYVERDIEITDIRVGIDGAPLRSASKFLDLGSTSHVSVALARFDVWLLPFLDVYGLLGYVTNTTTTRGTATVPTLGPGPGVRTFTLSATTNLDGLVGGAGLTLAGGYREIFVVGDVNYSQTDIGFDDRFRALIGTVRVGWNGKIQEIPLRLWVGGMYWGTRSTAKASVDVPNVGRVRFEADQGPVNPVNATVGGSVTLFRRWDAFVEYGFNGKDVQAISTGLTFRF